MPSIGGILFALVALGSTWATATATTKNLPAGVGQGATLLLLVVAALAGFLAGSVIFRRARRTREHIALFSLLAGGVAGALIGCAHAVLLTATYLGSYSTWPSDRFDQVFVLLAYPAFGLLGLLIGAAFGSVAGIVIGSAARLGTSPA